VETGRQRMEADMRLADEVRQVRDRIATEVARRVVGQADAIEQLLVALFAEGHGLLIGVPGLAKTTLVQALAECLDLTFSRIQFTPDLMPSDVTGTEVLEEDRSTGARAFRFVRGPVFANLLLADEINRTPPKTQSALLEAMQERRVTVAGQSWTLAPPFVVFATQNPIEQEGTYPLPEAQLDRFTLAIRMDYPSFDQEMDIVQATTGLAGARIQKVLDPARILEVQALVRGVPAPDFAIREAVELVRSTRPDDPGTAADVRGYVAWGAGPRAAQHLVLAAKALTLLRGRTTVPVEFVREMAVPVLAHRVVVNFHAEAERVSAVSLVRRLVEDRG